MKNQVMAMAITGIDDNLIEDAQNIVKKSRKLSNVYSICALAACLVLVFTCVFAFSGRNNTQLFVNGNEISDSPVVIDFPVAAFARETTTETYIPLALKPAKETTIEVTKGTMEIYSSDTNAHLFTGSQFTVNQGVNVYWVVDGSDINNSYRLMLNDNSVYELSHDETTGSVSICKQ